MEKILPGFLFCTVLVSTFAQYPPGGDNSGYGGAGYPGGNGPGGNYAGGGIDLGGGPLSGTGGAGFPNLFFPPTPIGYGQEKGYGYGNIYLLSQLLGSYDKAQAFMNKLFVANSPKDSGDNGYDGQGGNGNYGGSGDGQAYPSGNYGQ